MLHPVGPLPPRVYWTRRVVLLAIFAVILIAVAVSCGAGSGSGHAAASPETKTKTQPSASTTPSASTAPAPCRRKQLAVTASTDAATYTSGTLPRLRLTVRNVR